MHLPQLLLLLSFLHSLHPPSFSNKFIRWYNNIRIQIFSQVSAIGCTSKKDLYVIICFTEVEGGDCIEILNTFFCIETSQVHGNVAWFIRVTKWWRANARYPEVYIQAIADIPIQNVFLLPILYMWQSFGRYHVNAVSFSILKHGTWFV